MKQAKLYILCDLSVNGKEIDTLVHQSTLRDFGYISNKFEKYRGLFEFFPDTPTPYVQWLGKNDENEHLLCFNGIHIRIGKHLIRCNTETLLKTWRDFEDFRMAIHAFLADFLRPFQTETLLFIPSFWKQPFGTVKNEWHEKRLQLLQEKITCHTVSFKRNLLNLQHCLGNPQNDWNNTSDSCYWLLHFSDIDSGKLTVWATLKQWTEPLMVSEQITRNLQFSCHPQWRNNVCPFMNYEKGKEHACNDGIRCRAVPYCGTFHMMEDFIRHTGYACWNKHCFFTLELHNRFVRLTFSKPASTLMHPDHRKECMQFIANILSHFPLQDAWLGSEESFEALESIPTTPEIQHYLETHYLLCRDASMITSWRQSILEL